MNLAFFSGRITEDITTRYTQNGTPVGNFSLAVETGFGDYKRTEFPKFVLWKRGNLVQHLTKGKPVIVTAEMQERKWQDKEGNNRRSIEFVVRDIEFQQGEPKGQGQQEQKQGATEQMGPAPF